MLLRNKRAIIFAATAASAATLTTPGAAQAKPPKPSKIPLTSLQEALTNANMRFTSASLMEGSTWLCSYTSTELRSKARTAQSRICDVETGATIASLPVQQAVDVTRDPTHGIELRQSASEDKKLVVEVWESSTGVRLARRVLADVVGPKILAPGVFGRPAFSPSGSAIAWSAERQPSGVESKGYWPPASARADEADGGGEEDEALASKVRLGRYSLADARSTGEALGAHNSVLVVWDWHKDDVRVIKPEEVLPDGALPANGGVAVPSHPSFDGTDDGLIFSCHTLPPWFPGLSACLNRPTSLFHLRSIFAGRGDGQKAAAQAAAKAAAEGVDKGAADAAAAPPSAPPQRAACLTSGLYFAHFPRLSPDGTALAFLAREEEFIGHSTVVELRTMAWPPPAGGAPPASSVVLPLVREKPAGAYAFGGICGYHDEHASLAWVDDGRLVFHTISAARKAAYVVDAVRRPADGALPPSPRALTPPEWDGGSVEVLGTANGAVILQASSIRSAPTLWAYKSGRGGASSPADGWTLLADNAAAVAAGLGKLSPDAADLASASGLTAARAALAELRGARLERVCLPDEEGGAEALVALPPPTAMAMGGAVACPWVLRPHGGPHGTAVDAFDLQTALLLLSGVAVILPNYRGSLGYGADFAESLLGHVGEMDVADCAALTRAALEAHAPVLDPRRGAVYGGSHGGFLTAWLIGAEATRDMYQCGVLWNPVVDLHGMLGATDIPEWVYAEGLAAAGPTWPLTPDDVVELLRRSPISVVDQVRVPALMLIGDGDQRVPPSQGRQWVAAVQQNGRSPEVLALSFPGDGHAIPSVEANGHAVQTALAWILEKLQA